MKKLLTTILLIIFLSLFISNVKSENELIILKLQKGNKTAYINDQPFQMDVTPIEVPPGRIMVPVRFISEGFGAKVYWDNNSETVSIYMDNVYYYKNKALRLEKDYSILKDENSNQNKQIESLNSERNDLILQNNILQNKIKKLEEDNNRLIEQINILNNQILDLQKKEENKLSATDIYEKNKFKIALIEKYDRRGKLLGKGSGFIATEDGKMLTNFHVIEKANYLLVKFIDGRNVKITELINYDINRDLAVIKIPVDQKQSIMLGDSDKIKPGDEIVVISNPLGLELTVSTGVISFTNRILDNQTWIQFSAPVSPGSSGGPIFNLKGEIIGIVTSKIIYEGVEGINFAIPINDVNLLLKTEKRVSFNDLFGIKSFSDLTDQEIIEAINFGKSCKDFFELFDKFSIYKNEYSFFYYKTNVAVATPYFWIAYTAYKNKESGKDMTLEDGYKILEKYKDDLTFFVTIFGDYKDFAKYYSSWVILDNKKIYPYYSYNTDIANMTSRYPKSPKYYALNAYFYYNFNIPRDSVIDFVINNGFGKVETFSIDLKKFP